jgi:hypothetical protein
MALRIEVEPPLPTDPRLEAPQVRSSDEHPTARDEPAPDALEHGTGLGEMLEHVPEDGCVERLLRQLHVLDALAHDGEPRRGGGNVAERLDGGDPVTGARQRDGETPVAGSEIEDARPGETAFGRLRVELG